MKKKYDIVFKNGTVIDGSGNNSFKADVAVVNDMIVAVGELDETLSKKVVDIAGKAISPGFIDVHTHDDNAVLKSPDCLPKISQGVTSVIVGNCGLSAAPVRLDTAPPDPLNLLGDQEDFIYADFRTYVNHVNEAQPAVNVGALVGHTSLRVNHMGSLYRQATFVEIEAMQKELHECLEQGAVGLSTGLAYGTARESTTEEIIALAKVVNEHDGIYVTHLRNEFDKVIDAIEECCNIGEASDIPVVISHLKCAGPDNWGRSQEVLDFIENSPYSDRVHMDCYPYAAGSSTLDLGQVDERVKILITWSEKHPEVAKKYLSEIAKEWGVTQLEAAEKLMPAGAVYFSISEEDMKRIISHPKTMIGSDGLPHDPHPHPRLWGTFPRVIGKLSREQKLFKLSEAVHKMTGLSAKNYRLHKRGLIREGFYADLVVFDPETIEDTGTFSKPATLSTGIESVYVNGIKTFSDGQLTGQRSGRYIGRDKATIKELQNSN
ncbi:MAG: amidohydrolase family protein [Lentisphaeraceae bacterium]|nr:amidohydrolase family protein [Lentisphaeraceae bacterium]